MGMPAAFCRARRRCRRLDPVRDVVGQRGLERLAQEAGERRGLALGGHRHHHAALAHDAAEVGRRRPRVVHRVDEDAPQPPRRARRRGSPPAWPRRSPARRRRGRRRRSRGARPGRRSPAISGWTSGATTRTRAPVARSDCELRSARRVPPPTSRTALPLELQEDGEEPAHDAASSAAGSTSPRSSSAARMRFRLSPTDSRSVRTTTSGATGGSYGSETPVKCSISPRSAFA